MTFVTKVLALEALDRFLLGLFRDHFLTHDDCAFAKDVVCQGGVFMVDTEGGDILVWLMVFHWFDPFGFED